MSQLQRDAHFLSGGDDVYGLNSLKSLSCFHIFQVLGLKHLVLMLQVLLAITGVGCTSDAFMNQPSNPVFEVAVMSTGSNQSCSVEVTINMPGEDLTLEVEVEAEAGVIFDETGGSVSGRESLQMFAEDSRTLKYPCRFDLAPITRSGAYIVRARAFPATSTTAQFNAYTKLYVYISQVDGVPPTIVSAEAFMEKYQGGFKDGPRNLHYQIVLDADQQPNSGQLYLLVNSPRDQYAPYLKIDANGGVEFVPNNGLVAVEDTTAGNAIAVQLGSIAGQGSRVLVVPFRLLEGSHEGYYSIRVSEQVGEEISTESAPFRLQIASAAEDPGQQWLALDSNFISAQQPQIERGSIKVIAEQGQPTPETFVESPQTLLPQAPPPTPAEVSFEPDTKTRIVWDLIVLGFSGTLRDGYEKFVSGKVPLAWEKFETLVVACNPQLVEDGYAFRQDQQYFLPRVVLEAPVLNN